jgi:hypothetical protein
MKTIENELTLFGNPICMILGNIGNAFIVIIFSRQRQSACGIYLIGSAIVNIISITFSAIASIFIFYYPSSTILVISFCKIYKYILYIFGQVPKTLLVLVCIDRFLITSTRASFRAFSTPKRAKYLIFFSFIFWSLTTLHVPIMITVVNGQCTTAGIYSIIYSLYAIIFVGLIPSIMSATFGYLTYRSMRQIKRRVQPVAQNRIEGNNYIQRQDRNLLIIVIAEVFVYVITTALFPLIQLEMMISQYAIPEKSFQYLQIEIFILNIALFLLSVNTAAAFYTYLIVSKSFRQDFKQLIINSYRKLRRLTIVEIIPRADQTLTQRDTRR